MDSAELRFERIWSDNARAVLRYAYRQVPRSEVDDVVAETFAVAWRRLDEIPERALPWLLGVARGVAANARRSSQRRSALHLRIVRNASADASPDVSGVDADLDPAAAQALAGLSARDRELLTLLAWDGLSPSEAATVTGCSPPTLHVRLHRARTRFRVLLAEASSQDPPRPTEPRSSRSVIDCTGGAR